MSGITPSCASCGRPIINGSLVHGFAGETYHAECTRPPVEPVGYPVQRGCICPPGAEQTCMGEMCPRKPMFAKTSG